MAELDMEKLSRMKRRILELEKENLLTHKYSDHKMKEAIRAIIIEETRKKY